MVNHPLGASLDKFTMCPGPTLMLDVIALAIHPYRPTETTHQL